MDYLSMFAVGALGLALAVLMRRRGQTPVAYVTAALLCVVNPFTWEAIRLGHSVELLGGALCVGAVLAARRSRTLAATALLGLALALAVTEWAVVDPVVALVATPLAALWWRSPRRTPDDALGLLALVFLLRGALDPASDASVYVPFLLALVSWEGLTRRGLPFVSLVSVTAIFSPLLTIPVAAWLAARVYVPSRRLPRLRAWPYGAPRVPVS